jgi:hypothetical protein
MTAKGFESQPSPQFPESSFTYNPLTHTRVLFVRFFQGLFAAAPSGVGAFHWSPHAEETELVISDEEVIQPDVIEKNPAITLARGPIMFQSMGLDDMEQYDMQTGQKTRGMLIPGTMTVNCISRESLESEQLAFFAADHLWILREVMLEQGFFDVGRNIQLGSPSPAGAIIANERGHEFISTAFTVQYMFPRLSTTTPLSRQIVNNIRLSMNMKPKSAVPQMPGPFPPFLPAIPQQETAAPNFAPNAADAPQRNNNVFPNPTNPATSVQVTPIYPRTGSRPASSVVSVPLDRPTVKR